MTDFMRDQFIDGSCPVAIINTRTGGIASIGVDDRNTASTIRLLVHAGAREQDLKVVHGFSKERLQQLTYGYDLDGGGYAFENPPPTHPLADCACVVWDDPDLDYIIGSDFIRITDYSCPVLAFAPNTGYFPATVWPEGWTDEDGDEVVRIAEGQLHETDHQCNCHGKLELWTGAAGEPTEPLRTSQVMGWILGGMKQPDLDAEDIPDEGFDLYFHHTGGYDDDPYPDCGRCGGEGTLDSPAGEFAIFALREDDDA